MRAMLYSHRYGHCARVYERLVVEAENYSHARSIYPDVKISEPTRAADIELERTNSSVAVAEPLVIRVESETTPESFIQIIDPTTGGRLVTVVEFLSPSNKVPGDGQRKYKLKQDEYCAARVNLVKIDLLRAGEWVLSYNQYGIPPQHRTPYRVMVRREHGDGQWEFYSIGLRDKLPAIRIPLRENDKDATLNLQALIEQVYVNGGYDDLDYNSAIQPPLSSDDAAWAAEIVRR